MGFNQRSATPLDFNTDDLLPQADSAQPHDIPTGVSPTTAKLQDWIAWLRDNGVFTGTGPITLDDDTTIEGDVTVEGNQILENFLSMSGTAPTASADPGANVFHNAHFPKVWGRIYTDGVGGFSLLDGVNIGGINVATNYVDVTFARNFANANYAPVATNLSGSSSVAAVDYLNSTASKVRLEMRNAAGTLVDPATTICRWSLIVMGRQ